MISNFKVVSWCIYDKLIHNKDFYDIYVITITIYLNFNDINDNFFL